MVAFNKALAKEHPTSVDSCGEDRSLERGAHVFHPTNTLIVGKDIVLERFEADGDASVDTRAILSQFVAMSARATISKFWLVSVLLTSLGGPPHHIVSEHTIQCQPFSSLAVATPCFLAL